MFLLQNSQRHPIVFYTHTVILIHPPHKKNQFYKILIQYSLRSLLVTTLRIGCSSLLATLLLLNILIIFISPHHMNLYFISLLT